MAPTETCPCRPDRPYSYCCAPFHLGTALPATAEELMRSRYSGFVKAFPDYLMATTHTNLLPQTDRSSLLNFATSVKWFQLIIKGTEAGKMTDATGKVEFQAWFEQGGKLNCIWEKSHFEREEGRWKYHSGQQKGMPRIGRNDPCPCGSGKKYKKCHG